MLSDLFTQLFRKLTIETCFYLGVLLLWSVELNQPETQHDCSFPSVYCVLQ